MLLEAVMRFWKLEKLEHLIEFSNQTPTPDLSQLAPLVVSCAEAGDVRVQFGPQFIR